MLTTDRLLIRPARIEDAEALFEVYGDPETMLYWDSLPDETRAQTQKRVRRFVGAQTYFVLEHQGRAIGTAGVHRDAEIGYILNRAHWRQGLMREALLALIPWLFDRLRVDELTTDVDPHNTASIALLHSLGFRETGRDKNTLQVGDVWFDSVYLALAQDDFTG